MKQKYSVIRDKSHIGNCSNCNKNVIYSEKYDTYYCDGCNTWLEDTCDDPTCSFCKDRPKYPINKKKQKKNMPKKKSINNKDKPEEIIGELKIENQNES